MVEKSAMLQGWSNSDGSMEPKAGVLEAQTLNGLPKETSTPVDSLVDDNSPGKRS